MRRDHNGQLIGWFIAGTAVGAAIALLLAPQSGARTRRTLKKQAERGRKALVDSEIFEKGRELYERGREIAEEAADLFERGRRIAEKTIDERT